MTNASFDAHSSGQRARHNGQVLRTFSHIDTTGRNTSIGENGESRKSSTIWRIQRQMGSLRKKLRQGVYVQHTGLAGASTMQLRVMDSCPQTLASAHDSLVG